MTVLSKFGLSFALSIFLSSYSTHKFYASQTEIQHNSNTRSLEISISLFTDDFEKALEDKNMLKLFLGSPKEHSYSDSLIYLYLEDNFKVFQQDERMPYNYIGKKVGLDNTINLYLEIESFSVENKLTVENTLLIELFEKQVNTVNYNNKGLVQSASLNKDKTKTTFSNSL